MTWRQMVGWGVRHWMAGLIGLAFGAVGGLSVIYYVNTQPPVVVDSLDVADGVIQDSAADDTISFVAHLDRHRSCPVQVSRFLWRWVLFRGERIKEFRGIENPPLNPMPGQGPQSYMITLRVPEGLPPGQWFERTVTLTQCPVFGSLFSEPPHVSPDRPITIKDAKP